MKLTIVKDQAKGVFGGVKFEFRAKVQLTVEEADLIRKYKADKEVLVQKDIKIPLTGQTITLHLTIGSLVEGQTFKCKDIAEILEYERSVKDSCQAFKGYLEVMKNFGGEEVYTFVSNVPDQLVEEKEHRGQSPHGVLVLDEPPGASAPDLRKDVQTLMLDPRRRE